MKYFETADTDADTEIINFETGDTDIAIKDNWISYRFYWYIFEAKVKSNLEVERPRMVPSSSIYAACNYRRKGERMCEGLSHRSLTASCVTMSKAFQV